MVVGGGAGQLRLIVSDHLSIHPFNLGARETRPLALEGDASFSVARAFRANDEPNWTGHAFSAQYNDGLADFFRGDRL
ncbi:unnamed protein product [Protopolystoma xenopodis]|uniref:Uncharacterized protein n=1 Tax=Protopolystoma xenopodis TaxID=117903 RepID=A0A3S5CDE7_9PLAT|nr:unnamed protein product [Protopolystoma xenopodis]